LYSVALVFAEQPLLISNTVTMFVSES